MTQQKPTKDEARKMAEEWILRLAKDGVTVWGLEEEGDRYTVKHAKGKFKTSFEFATPQPEIPKGTVCKFYCSKSKVTAVGYYQGFSSADGKHLCSTHPDGSACSAYCVAKPYDSTNGMYEKALELLWEALDEYDHGDHKAVTRTRIHKFLAKAKGGSK